MTRSHAPIEPDQTTTIHARTDALKATHQRAQASLAVHDNARSEKLAELTARVELAWTELKVALEELKNHQ